MKVFAIALAAASLATRAADASIKLLAATTLLYGSFEVISLFGLRSSFVEARKQYGAINALLLLLIFPDAKHVVKRIELHLLASTNDEAKDVKQSLSEECTMLAVAAAIVAQVAITGLSMDGIGSVHWTAKAAFIMSLITGALSVFYACLLQQKLSSLFGAEDMKRWLSKPGSSTAYEPVEAAIRRYVERRKQTRSAEDHFDNDAAREEIETMIKQYIEKHHLKTASFYSALIIKIPAILLNYSVGAFLIGLGIYLGCVTSRYLNANTGREASIAVLVVYCLVTVIGLLLYAIPNIFKMLEFSHIRRWETLMTEVRKNDAKNTVTRIKPTYARLFDYWGWRSHGIPQSDGEDSIPEEGPRKPIPFQVPALDGNEGHGSIQASRSNHDVTIAAALERCVVAQEQSLAAMRVLQSEFQKKESVNTAGVDTDDRVL